MGLDPHTLRLEPAVDGPDTPFSTQGAVLETDPGGERVDADGEVLRGPLAGDPLLSVRGDAAEECWRIVAPALGAWRAGEVLPDEHPADSTGPAAGPQGGGAEAVTAWPHALPFGSRTPSARLPSDFQTPQPACRATRASRPRRTAGHSVAMIENTTVSRT